MPWKFASLGSVVAALVLAGCSSTSEPKTPVAPVADAGYGRCNAAAAEFAIGQKASTELLEQARVKSGAHTARVLKPSDMVTMEYRSDRLNLNTDDSLTITRINCG